MKRRSKIAAAVIVGIGLLYPLSMGPAIRIAMPRGSWGPAPWFTKVYAPLIWTIKQRQPGGSLLARYMKLWAAPDDEPDGPNSGGPSAVVQPAGMPNLTPQLLTLAREGKEQFERGNYPEAEKTYRKILVKAPNNLHVLSNLGVVLFRAGKFQLAEETFKQAIAVAPDDAFSHCTLGIVYFSQNKHDEAINELMKALALDPQNATAHNYLGLAATAKGWPEAAAKEFETARKLDPNLATPPSRDEGGRDFLTPLEKERLGAIPGT